MFRRSSCAALATAFFLSLGGCATQRETQNQAVVAFKAGSLAITSEFVPAIEAIDTESVNLQRERKFSAGEPPVAGEIRGAFDVTDLELRERALGSFSSYCTALVAISTSDTPQEARSATASLTAAAANLVSTTEMGGGRSAQTPEIKAAAGVLGAIAGDVTQLMLRSQIDNALRLALSRGRGPVKKLTGAMKIDAGTAEAEAVALAETRYSVARRSLGVIDAQNALDAPKYKAVKKVLDQNDRLLKLAKSKPLTKGASLIDEGYANISAFLEGPRSARDIVSLQTQMEEFQRAATSASARMKELRALSNE